MKAALFISTSLVALSVIFALPVQAAHWTVDSNPGRPATFRTLQEAHDSPNVSIGDTLYLLPSSISYGSLIATKRLNVFGPGYLLHQNLSFTNAVPSASVPEIVLTTGTSGSLYSGLEIMNEFQVTGGVNNVTLNRNRVHDYIIISGITCENISIIQNFVSSGSGHGHLSISGSGNGVVRGNYFEGQVSLASGTNWNMQHNVVGADVFAAGSSFIANNLIAGTLYIDENVSADSNWSGNISIFNNASSVSPHLWTAGTTFAGQFLGTGSLDGRWRLKADAAVIGTGKSGATPGMFTGPDPYVLSGLPSMPMVIGLQAPSSASASTGLPISLTLQVDPESFTGEIEYFFGPDPGPGLGTAVPVTNGSADFTVDTSGLSPGFHSLNIRAREGGGQWGPPFPMSVTIEPSSPQHSVAACEYSLGAPAAPGEGTALPLAPGSGRTASLDADLDTSDLPMGVSHAYFRVRDNEGTWGPPFPISVTIEPSSPQLSVAACEYSLGTPAAPGAGTALPLNPGSGRTAGVDAVLDTSAIPLGPSLAYFRVKDSEGTWGPAWPMAFIQDPDSFHGIAPAPAKLVTYLNQDGNVVEGSYAEHPLPGAATGSHLSLVLPLVGVPSAESELVSYVVADTGEVSPQANTLFNVVVQGTNGYAQWRTLAENFSAGEQADDTISGMMADPDRDGLSNALEFALSTHPKSDSSSQVPAINRDSGNLRFTFRQRAGGDGHRAFGYTAGGVQYQVEWSHTLSGDWRSGGDDAFTVTSVSPNGDGTETIVVTTKTGLTDDQSTTFLRLKVILL